VLWEGFFEAAAIAGVAVANSATERTAVKIKQPLDKRGRGPCLCFGRSVGALVGPTDMGSNALRSRD
jgi:hypothetical protein